MKKTIRLGVVILVVAAMLAAMYFLFLKPSDIYAKYEQFTSEEKAAGEIEKETVEENDVTWVLRYPSFEEKQLMKKVDEIKEEALQMKGKEGDVISLDYRSLETYSHYISVEMVLTHYNDDKDVVKEKNYLFTYDKETANIMTVQNVLRGQYHDLLKELDKDGDVSKEDTNIWVEEDAVYVGKKQVKVPFKNNEKYLSLLDENIKTLAPKGSKLITPMEVDPNKPMIAFTFDDGPHYENTDRVVSLFESYGGKATFFMLGKNVEANEEVVKRVHDAGFEIGSHTYSHENLPLLPLEELQEEIYKTQDAIFKITGQDPVLLRPPFGEYNDLVEEQSDMTIALWGIDTLDWSNRNPQMIKDAILTYASDGAVVLLHDIYDTSHEGVKMALPELAAQGYQFVDMSTLLKYRY